MRNGKMNASLCQNPISFEKASCLCPKPVYY
jgi:hypothetical protein